MKQETKDFILELVMIEYIIDDDFINDSNNNLSWQKIYQGLLDGGNNLIKDIYPDMYVRESNMDGGINTCSELIEMIDCKISEFSYIVNKSLKFEGVK